jgi:hypothetical protein
VTESILDSTKKNLGIAQTDTTFDVDIIMHINSVFSTLEQLGVGPAGGFAIVDDTAVWSDFLGTDHRLNQVKTYMYLRVRLIFDPPQSSYAITAMQEQIKEHEWRLNVIMEATLWTDPDPDEPDLEEEDILDGGAP